MEADEKLFSGVTLADGADDATGDVIGNDVTDVTDDVLDGDVDEDDVIPDKMEADVDVFMDNTVAVLSGTLFSVLVCGVVSKFFSQVELFTVF